MYEQHLLDLNPVWMCTYFDAPEVFSPISPNKTVFFWHRDSNVSPQWNTPSLLGSQTRTPINLPSCGSQ